MSDREIAYGLAFVVLAFIVAGVADGCIDRQEWQTCMRASMQSCAAPESQTCRGLVEFTCGARP